MVNQLKLNLLLKSTIKLEIKLNNDLKKNKIIEIKFNKKF